MKKILFSIMLVFALLISIIPLGCGAEDGDNSGGKGKFIQQIISSQVHEEKAGYVFCGYFHDEDFTRRVTAPVTSVNNPYYPKYQLDRASALNCYNGVSQEYKYPSMELDFIVYATGYYDAYSKYISVLPYYNEKRLPNISYNLYLSDTITVLEFDRDETGRNQWHNFHDALDPTIVASGVDGEIYYFNPKHDVKWKCYIGDVVGVYDCWEYYIVDDEYAVISGLQTSDYYKNNKIETLTIPSTIEGKPVKEFSVNANEYLTEQVNIGTLVVPGCVENFYLQSEMLNWGVGYLDAIFCVDKIKFNEGVKTIRLITDGQEDLEIPSTAYYVDLQRPFFGYDAPCDAWFVGDRDIQVNGGEHYYTDGTFLCSKEGDLVQQYANMYDLSVTINSNIKRVLRQSIIGPFVKNITVPANVEYFDVNYNRWFYRDRSCAGFRESFKDINETPRIMIEGEKCAKQLLDKVVEYDFLDPIHNLKTSIRFRFLQFRQGINVKGLLAEAVNRHNPAKTNIEKQALVNEYYEILSLPEFNVENNVVYYKKVVFTPDYSLDQWGREGTFTKEENWSVFAYLYDNYPKNSLSDLEFDSMLLRAYVDFGFTGLGDLN